MKVSTVNNGINDDEIAPKDGIFTVQLNGQKDMENRLAEFKKACDAYDKHRRKRNKKRFYNLGLMAKVVKCTTEDELVHLLKNGCRTFSVDTVTNNPQEVDALVYMINQAVARQQAEEPCYKLVVGLALEITGDCCRIGRIRNNCSFFLSQGNTMTLTTNIDYRYSCFEEISYVINLKYYLHVLKLNDQILIGPEVRAKIVKILKSCVAILIENAGIVNSYDSIELPNQCYSLQIQTLPDMFKTDIELASKVQADFIIMTQIRCLSFLKVLRYNLKEYYNFKIIGSIDLEYVSAKMLDLMSIIKHLDFLWLPNLFNRSADMYTYLSQDVIPLAKFLKKPIIGTVPLERLSDVRTFENHEFLWKIDCIFIEKSRWCNKYPLIVKKLLPIKNYRMATLENTMALNNILSSFQSVVNFIIRTISTIECQAIFLYSKCESAASALARVEIYCPVFVSLPLDDIDLNNEEELQCRTQLAKRLNLRRNLKVILYSSDMNECNLKPIDFSMDFARRNGCLETGDFVISIEVGKEGGGENVQLGIGEDVVIMRAFYMPPLPVGNKFKCD